MAETPGMIRSQVLLLMKSALAEGQSASAFIRGMQAEGLSYRRTEMLSDWRSVGEIEKKTGLLRYVRKGYIPSAELAKVEAWRMSKEFLFKVRVQTRLAPGEPITDRYVNIMSDVPLTTGQMAEKAVLKLRQSPKGAKAELIAVIPETGIRRAFD